MNIFRLFFILNSPSKFCQGQKIAHGVFQKAKKVNLIYFYYKKYKYIKRISLIRPDAITS